MSTFEINKMVGALLTVGVVAMFGSFLAGVLMKPQELETPAYSVLVEEEESDAMAEAGEEMEAPAMDLGALLASADAAAGEKVTKKCTACHTFEQGGANKIGPNLWNLIGQPIAGASGYSYSDALAGMSGDTWTYENLSAFLLKPKDFAPGTKMSFAGLKKDADRANLILYMRNLSDSPAPLP